MSNYKGEIGQSSSLVHDTMNNIFAKNKIFSLITKIDVYYTETGIIGVFPLFKDNKLNNEINKESYYPKFLKEYDKITQTLKSKGIEIKHEETKFYKGESISRMKVVYDENKQQILSLKISTQNKVYSYGNHSLFNKRENTILSKPNNFIPGFKCGFIKDSNGIPYLTYIRTHFALDDDFHKYYYEQRGDESERDFSYLKTIFSFPFYCLDKIGRYILNVLDKIIKFLIILCLILLPILTYCYHSQNIYNGIIKVNNVNSNYSHFEKLDSIKIYTDKYGFTHIKANSIYDTYFALGFEHAKSRLWQIDIQRRTARGKLSEFFGNFTLKIDLTIRKLGLNELAIKFADYVRKNSKYINEVNSYIDGINFYAKNFLLPIEYDLTFTKFEEWTLEDTIALLNFHSFALSHDWNMEVWYKSLEEGMGKEFADIVFSYRDVNYPFWNDTIVNDDELMELGLHKFRKKSEEILKKERDFVKNFQKEKKSEEEGKNEKKEKKINEEDLKNMGKKDNGTLRRDDEDVKKSGNVSLDKNIKDENETLNSKKNIKNDDKLEEKISISQLKNETKKVSQNETIKEQESIKKQSQNETIKKQESIKKHSQNETIKEQESIKKETQNETIKEQESIKKQSQNETLKEPSKQESEKKTKQKLESQFGPNTVIQNQTKQHSKNQTKETSKTPSQKSKKDQKPTYQKNQNQTSKTQPKKNQKIKTPETSSSFTSGPLQTEGASNCWVLSGNYTTSGKPLLSNDPHLPNNMPSLFFVVKLYLEDDIISGASLPGTPFIATGSNKFVTWGLTTENSDNTDLCEERIEDNFYIYDNKKFPIEIVHDEIKVRFGKNVNFDIKYTRNGPLVDETVPKEFLLLNQPFHFDSPISFRSAFYKFNFTNFDFYFGINFAKNKNDFLSVVHKAVAPNYNFHYATRDGEIGWIPLGRVTVKNFYNRFCRGYTSEDDILKYVPRSEMLHLENPKKGFIVTANNKPASFNYTYELRGHHNHVRAHRINEMILKFIKENHKITINDTMKMINDVHESLAEYILPKILKIIEKNSRFDINQNKYYSMLKKWNFEMNKDSREATIYSVFERDIGYYLLENKFNDILARGEMSYLHYWNFITGIIDKLYKGERIDMKQCAYRSGNSNCEIYLVNIFNNLEMSLKKYMDKNGEIKKWGEINSNDFPHIPFDNIPLINKFFSRRIFGGGNKNTVKIARGPYNHKKSEFIGTQSARLKFICEMNDPFNPYIVIPGGNGGSPFNKYFDNLSKEHEDAVLYKFENVDFENISNDDDRLIILQKEKLV